MTPLMTGPAATFLSLAVLGAFALAAGGLYTLFARRDRKHGLLMLLAAAVLAANVAVWTV
jgi:hypothetical protein